MSPGPTTTAVVSAIVAKDLKSFRRNKFLVFITILTLFSWALIFYLLPSSVDDTVRLGVVAADVSAVTPGGHVPPGDTGPSGLAGDGVEITVYPGQDELRGAILSGDVAAGIVLPPGMLDDIAAGRRPEAVLLVPAGLPPQIQQLLTAGVNELGHALVGQTAPVDLAAATEIVGVDRIGDPVSLAERMRPMLLISVLLLEIISLASLLSVEIADRTISAILVTPVSPRQLLAAKAVFGVAFAFTEVLVLGLLIGAFSANTVIVLLGLFLGAVMVTGLGLLVGSFGRDFLDTLVLSMLVMIPLLVPAFAAFLPGGTAAWVKVLPTSGLVEVLTVDPAAADAWSQVAGPLLVLLAWGLGTFALGIFVLRRRVVAP